MNHQENDQRRRAGLQRGYQQTLPHGIGTLLGDAIKFPGLFPLSVEAFITLMMALITTDKFDNVSEQHYRYGEAFTLSGDFHTEAKVVEEMVETLRTTGVCTGKFNSYYLPLMLNPILTTRILDLVFPGWRINAVWYIETIRAMIPRLEERGWSIYNPLTGALAYLECGIIRRFVCHTTEYNYILGGFYYEEPPVHPLRQVADPVRLNEVAGLNMELMQLFLRQFGEFHIDDLPNVMAFGREVNRLYIERCSREM